MNKVDAIPEIQDITRPDPKLVDALREMGAATASSTLFHIAGIVNSHCVGPTAWTPGQAVAGPAVTLQFMPKRADLYSDAEYEDVEKQLHRHALYHVEAGDVVVVDARANMRSGIFGDMMLTYFKGRGGAGLVIDGCLRDWPNVQKLGIPTWMRGVTPNFHTQTELMPYAVNTPIACGECFVMAGDIMIADDDGVVVVPIALADELVGAAKKSHGWEGFSREKLSAGADLRRYYPLHDDARSEYEAWLRERGDGE